MTQGSGTLSTLSSAKSFSLNAILAQLQNATPADGGVFSSFLTTTGQAGARLTAQSDAGTRVGVRTTSDAVATTDTEITAAVADMRDLARSMRDFIARVQKSANAQQNTATTDTQTAAKTADVAVVTIEKVTIRVETVTTTDAETAVVPTETEPSTTDTSGLSDILTEVLALLQQVATVLPQLPAITQGGLSAQPVDAATDDLLAADLSAPLAPATLPALQPAEQEVLPEFADAAPETTPPQPLSADAEILAPLPDADATDSVTAQTFVYQSVTLVARMALPETTTTTAATNLAADTDGVEPDPLIELLQSLRDEAKTLAGLLDAAAQGDAAVATDDQQNQMLLLAAALLNGTAQLTGNRATALPQLLMTGDTATQDLTAISLDALTQQANTNGDLTQLVALIAAKTKDALTSLHMKAQLDATQKVDQVQQQLVDTALGLPSATTTDAATSAATTTATAAAAITTATAQAATNNMSYLLAAATGRDETAPTAAQVFANASAMVAAAETFTASSRGSDPDLSAGGRGGNAALIETRQIGVDALSGGIARGDTFSTHMQTARAVAMPSPAAQAGALNQVVVQISRAVKNGNDTISLQLHPAEMGTVNVRLDVAADGKVQGTVTADNPQTLDMLQKDSRSLERALQDAGLRADPGSLQFSLDDQAKRQQGQQAEAGQGSGDGSGDGGDGMESASDEGAVVAGETTNETYYITPNGVNIRV